MGTELVSAPLKSRFSCHGTVAPRQLPLDVPIDEAIPGYDPKYFYHPNPGDILDGKYKLKVKIGWGTTSTVWLAQDVSWRLGSKPYVAIKIHDCRSENGKEAQRELEISNQIINAQSSDDGHNVLRTIESSFEINSPNGIHVCFAMEPMREPLWILRRRFGADKTTAASLPLFRTYIFILLGALHYLHTECHIIHTGEHISSIP